MKGLSLYKNQDIRRDINSEILLASSGGISSRALYLEYKVKLQDENFLLNKNFKFTTLLKDSTLVDGFGFSQLINTYFIEHGFKCPTCGSLLKQGFAADKNNLYFYGHLVSDAVTSHEELLKFSYDIGATQVYIDGFGLLDVSSKKTFYSLLELEDLERAIFVENFFKAESSHIIALEDKFTYSMRGELYYEDENLKLVDFQASLFCFDCHDCAYTNLDNMAFDDAEIGDLLFLDNKNQLSYKLFLSSSFAELVDLFQSFSGQLTNVGYSILNFCQIMQVLEFNNLCFLDKLFNLSQEQYYLLSLANNLFFEPSKTRYYYRFPVLDEFSYDQKTDLKKIFNVNKELLVDELEDLAGLEIKSNNIQNFYQNRNTFIFLKQSEILDKIYLHADANIYVLDSFISKDQKQILSNKLDFNNKFFIDSILSYEEKKYNPNSSILTYLGLSIPISELYANHPLSKALGYKAAQFLFSKSEFACKECKLFQPVECSCRGKLFDQILEHVKWNGVSIRQVMADPINKISNTLSNLFISKKSIWDNLSNKDFSNLKLGTNLYYLNGEDHLKLTLLKYEDQFLKKGDLLFLSGVGNLIQNVNNHKFFMSFLMRLKSSGVSVVLTTLDHKFSSKH